jgi:spore maturation protein CgeB
MKIVVFGLTISSSWGNGHATLWRGLCRALARRGHKIVFFEKNAPYYALNRDLFEIPGGDLVLYETWESISLRAKAEVADADVAMVTSYCPDGIAATELVLDASGPTRIFYDLDTPITLSRLQAKETTTYIGPRGLVEFDWVLS